MDSPSRAGNSGLWREYSAGPGLGSDVICDVHASERALGGQPITTSNILSVRLVCCRGVLGVYEQHPA